LKGKEFAGDDRPGLILVRQPSMELEEYDRFSTTVEVTSEITVELGLI
jgi:hypothetical protein